MCPNVTVLPVEPEACHSAGNLDRQLFQAEQAFASGKEETEFYMSSLQALTLFKSKSERALLDVQSRADAAQREAREAKQRYEQVWLFKSLGKRPACEMECHGSQKWQNNCQSI
jgi:hypothetical protein